MAMNPKAILILVTVGAFIDAVPLSDVYHKTDPSPVKESISAEPKKKTEIHEKHNAVKEKGATVEDGDIEIMMEDSYEMPAEELLQQTDKEFEVDYVDPSIPESPYDFYQNQITSPFIEDEEMMEKAANIAAAFSIYKRRKLRRGHPLQAQRRNYLRHPYKRRGFYYSFYPIYYRRYLF